ncbi:MAG: MFS transporter, partial [bacterium]
MKRSSVGGLLLLVASVVFLDTVFFAAITPLLPHYTHEFALSKSEAGILSASYAIGGLIAALPGGWFVARFGAKPGMLLGLATMTVSSLVFAFGGSIEVLDGARFVQGLGSSFSWAGGLAWLVTKGPAARRGELIGSAMAAALVGVLLGPVLG